MANLLKFKALGFREARGRFAARDRLLQIEKRNMVRDVSREYVDVLREEAPKDKGIFADGIGFRTDDRDYVTTGTLFVAGPHAFLLDIITKGSRSHIIPKGGAAAQMVKGYPLRFFWENGPRGPDIYRFWSVRHPGTKPNDFVGRAQARLERPTRVRLNKTVNRVAYLT